MRHSTHFAAAAGAAVALFAHASFAQSPPASTSREWYGGEILAVDGVSLATLIVGGATDTIPLAAAGVVGLVIGGPIVHWAHGHVGKGFGSLGLRVGFPLGASALTSGLLCAATRVCDDDLGLTLAVAFGFAVGGIVGGITAIVLDSAVLAYEDVAAPAQSAPQALGPGRAAGAHRPWPILPTITLRRHGASACAGLSF